MSDVQAGTGGEPGHPRVWRDEGELDAQWSPPGSDGRVSSRPDSSSPDSWPDSGGTGSDGPRHRSRWLTVGVPVLAVVVLLVVVAALGGFGTRTDRVERVKAGATFTNGPFVVTFTKATVQNKAGFGEDERINELIVYGTARNTWHESLDLDSDWFVAATGTPRVVKGAEFPSLDYGDLYSSQAPSDLTPGLPAHRIKVEFEFPGTLKPGTTVAFGFSKLEYGTDSIFSTSDEEFWHNDRNGDVFRMELPLTKLPRESDDY